MIFSPSWREETCWWGLSECDAGFVRGGSGLAASRERSATLETWNRNPSWRTSSHSQGDDGNSLWRGSHQSPLCHRNVCHGLEHAGSNCALHERAEVWWTGYSLGMLINYLTDKLNDLKRITLGDLLVIRFVDNWPNNDFGLFSLSSRHLCRIRRP